MRNERSFTTSNAAKKGDRPKHFAMPSFICFKGGKRLCQACDALPWWQQNVRNLFQYVQNLHYFCTSTSSTLTHPFSPSPTGSWTTAITKKEKEKKRRKKLHAQPWWLETEKCIKCATWVNVLLDACTSSMPCKLCCTNRSLPCLMPSTTLLGMYKA